MTSRTYWESTDQQHLHVQFLGDKKGEMKVTTKSTAKDREV